MNIRRALKISLLSLVGVVALCAILVGSLWLYFHPAVSRVDGVVYGHRNGKDLAFDVLRPGHTNGVGVLLMVSGGWKSARAGSFQPWMAAPLLHRGYTVIPVYHVSQPEATVMEIVEDVNRAVRYIRHNAREYGIDPQRLGVTGGSAGGHLSLMLATRGAPGPAVSSDPIDRETSAVQAVAIFYPPTDLLNLGKSTENTGDGGPPRSFIKAFGPNCTNLAVWKNIGREMSPIYFVSSNLPPTLIYHGDADTLVTLDQSERFVAEARKLGCTIKLVVHPGGKHGWLTMIWDIRRFGAWFDQYLLKQT
jgi:acetyl esterase/lipase